MMKKYLLCTLVPALIAGCTQTPSHENTTSTTPSKIEVLSDGHTAENSLDWAGVYEGVFPCADCEGISTKLTLNNNYTYILEEGYLKNGISVFKATEKGRFKFDKINSSLIRLESSPDQRVFFVGENYVQQRDRQTGEPLSENLPYRLDQISK